MAYERRAEREKYCTNKELRHALKVIYQECDVKESRKMRSGKGKTVCKPGSVGS